MENLPRKTLTLLAVALAAGCTDTNPDYAPNYSADMAMPNTCDTQGLTACGQQCFDLQSDSGNCSGCNVKCGQGQKCSKGACTDLPDLAVPPVDLVQPKPDMTVAPPDLTTPPDLTVLPDLVVLPDLTMPPTCNDGIKNGLETDVDCGGPTCPKCYWGLGCKMNTDCYSQNCAANVCSNWSGPNNQGCTDGNKNGPMGGPLESDVDCGGGVCGPCGQGQRCGSNADCIKTLQCKNNAGTYRCYP